MNSRGDSTLWSLVDMGVAVIVPVLCLVVGAIGNSIFELAQRTSAIEASAYTKAEAKEDQQLLTRSVNDIKSSLHTIDKKATELTGSVKEIQKDVKELQAR